jgi:hypothetical protein
MKKKSIEKTFPDRAADVGYNAAYLYEKMDSSAGANACWTYHGARHRQGYGMIGGYRLATGKKIMQTVHRLLWKIQNNHDPGTQDIIHTCGNMACCNPAHLQLGDAKMIADMRTARGHTNSGMPYGWKSAGPRNQTYQHGLHNIFDVYHNRIDYLEFARRLNMPPARAKKICNDITQGRIYTWLKTYKETQ